MRMKEIFTAKSIEEAKHLAVEKLGTAPAMPYKEEIMAALNK